MFHQVLDNNDDLSDLIVTQFDMFADHDEAIACFCGD
jgi:hypothetical protein